MKNKETNPIKDPQFAAFMCQLNTLLTGKTPKDAFDMTANMFSRFFSNPKVFKNTCEGAFEFARNLEEAVIDARPFIKQDDSRAVQSAIYIHTWMSLTVDAMPRIAYATRMSHQQIQQAQRFKEEKIGTMEAFNKQRQIVNKALVKASKHTGSGRAHLIEMNEWMELNRLAYIRFYRENPDLLDENGKPKEENAYKFGDAIMMQNHQSN